MKIVCILVALAALSVAQVPSSTDMVTTTSKTSIPTRSSLIATTLNEVIPHITKGGNWTSKFVLFNVSTGTTSFRMRFFDKEGKVAAIPLKNMGSPTEVFGVLNSGASAWFETQADSSPLETQYWSRLIEGAGLIQGYVVFSWSVPGNTPVEVTVPLTHEAIVYPVYVPFDNTAGYKTALALTNTYTGTVAAIPYETYVLEARNTNGNVFFTRTLTLPDGHKTAFLLPDEFPELQLQKGTIRIRNVAGSDVTLISMLALQFNPSGSVTMILPYLEYQP